MILPINCLNFLAPRSIRETGTKVFAMRDLVRLVVSGHLRSLLGAIACKVTRLTAIVAGLDEFSSATIARAVLLRDCYDFARIMLLFDGRDLILPMNQGCVMSPTSIEVVMFRMEPTTNTHEAFIIFRLFFCKNYRYRCPAVPDLRI